MRFRHPIHTDRFHTDRIREGPTDGGANESGEMDGHMGGKWGDVGGREEIQEWIGQVRDGMTRECRRGREERGGGVRGS